MLPSAGPHAARVTTSGPILELGTGIRGCSTRCVIATFALPRALLTSQRETDGPQPGAEPKVGVGARASTRDYSSVK